MWDTVSFFKVRFLGSFGHLALLAVGFGASLAVKVSAAIFYRAKASKGSWRALRRTNFKKTYCIYLGLVRNDRFREYVNVNENKIKTNVCGKLKTYVSKNLWFRIQQKVIRSKKGKNFYKPTEIIQILTWFRTDWGLRSYNVIKSLKRSCIMLSSL